ncbi:hypothetical protein B0H11DRAFT_1867417 [Mycena galericulata]|nr:hypothetical protein B0H11DRAFT_1867417 [Mycena galericulata]
MQPKYKERLRKQRAKQPPVVTADLTGKTVCILGANGGIGFETSKHFAKMNPARLIVACRSEAKGREAVQKLQQETGYNRAELWLIDLADFASVQRFADKFETDGGRLDILIANAATEPGRYIPTKDGWDITVQVNYLAAAFSALLLLPILLRTGNEHQTLPRIVFVSSDLHYDVTIEKEVRIPGKIIKTLGSKEYCQVGGKRMQTHYSVTKLLNILFTRAFSAHLGPSAPVIVDIVAPGFCYSDLRRDMKGTTALMLKFLEWAIAFTTEEGSRRLVFAAIGLPDKPDTLRGQYIDDCQVQEPSDFVVSKEGQQVEKDVWVETLEILGKIDPRITQISQRYLGA